MDLAALMQGSGLGTLHDGDQVLFHVHVSLLVMTDSQILKAL